MHHLTFFFFSVFDLSLANTSYLFYVFAGSCGENFPKCFLKVWIKKPDLDWIMNTRNQIKTITNTEQMKTRLSCFETNRGFRNIFSVLIYVKLRTNVLFVSTAAAPLWHKQHAPLVLVVLVLPILLLLQPILLPSCKSVIESCRFTGRQQFDRVECELFIKQTRQEWRTRHFTVVLMFVNSYVILWELFKGFNYG